MRDSLAIDGITRRARTLRTVATATRVDTDGDDDVRQEAIAFALSATPFKDQ